MNLIPRLLQLVSNANIAYLLLTLGSIGLIVELTNPGLIFPGFVGAICLVLAFYALGVLDAYWGGVVLILLGMLLFVLELFITSHGILTGGGVASLTVGSLILFTGSSPELEVNRGLIAVVVIFFAAFAIFVLGAVVQGQRRKPATGRTALVGQTARALTPLEPAGTVLVEGERWLAELDSGTIEVGQEVVVTRVEGLKLFVSRKVKQEVSR